MNFVNSNANFANEIHVRPSCYMLLARRMRGLHGQREAVAQPQPQFLLEVKYSVSLVVRAPPNFTTQEPLCFFLIPFTHICKPTYKSIHTQDSDKPVQKWWIFAFQVLQTFHSLLSFVPHSIPQGLQCPSHL